MQKHRIFIAINLPENIKRELYFCQKRIEELFTPYRNEVSGSGPVRWVRPENLHITLFFLGYLSDEELLEVLQIVKEVVSKYKSFSINLNKISYGPPKKMPPKMIWAMGEKLEELGKLQKDLENSLLNSEVKMLEEPENRTFAPHVTLGRIRQWEFRAIELEERPIIDEDISLNFEVNSIEVMESQLKKGGAEYTILESVSLGKF